MASIVEFLEARIAEDDAAAQAAIANYAPDEWDNPASVGNYYPADIAFWDRQTPIRVLAECAAKREVLELAEDIPCMSVLRALAAVYSTHSDYQQEWAA